MIYVKEGKFFMKPDFFAVLNYCSSLTVVIPFLLLIGKVKDTWKYNPGLFLFVINNFLTEVVTVSCALMKIRTFELKIAVDLSESSFLFIIYYITFKNNKNKNLMPALALLLIAGYLLIYFFWDKYLFVPSHVFAFQHLMMLIPLILYFIERMRLMDDEYITKNPMFWVTSGFLIFYSVSIFYFSLFNELYFHYKEVFIKGWAINALALIIMNVLLSKGLWLIPKDSKSL
jgi:hypothetical protein